MNSRDFGVPCTSRCVVYSQSMISYSLYLHIPFCRHRCGYCDFNTYAGLETLIPDYTFALCREIEFSSRSARERLPVHTIFFGGGTPSLLPVSELEHILLVIADNFELSSDLEVTLEANPGTLSYEYLKDLKGLGVNRLSLGVQSANPQELRLLERQHTYLDVIQAVTWARQAGFDNLNLDLIYGLPEQGLDTWQHSVDLALKLHPEHFSLYALTMEHGTPFGHWAARGLLSEPDPDLAADMYEWASNRLTQAGYAQYEISNWGMRQGEQIMACRHNLQYWRNQSYLGFGAGAHGFASSVRTTNVMVPAAYIRRCDDDSDQKRNLLSFPRTPATQSVQAIDRSIEIGETMMMGLRLVQEGVSRRAFRERFDQELEEVFEAQISELLGLGLLEWAGENQDILRLTSQGRLLGNQVFYRFI